MKPLDPSRSEIMTHTKEEILAMGTQMNDQKLHIDLPDDHFISKYVAWLSELTDAYQEYMICSALWLLSACTQGKVRLELRQSTVRPNLWFFMLGLSSVSRKSTVLDKTKMVYESCTQTRLFNDDYSLEGYLELLQATPVCNFVRDEVVGLLQKMHKKYNDGIFECECAVYDGSSYRKTLSSDKKHKKHEVVVDTPFVTKLYCTTPDNFASNMTLDDMHTGYGPRFLYCYPRYERPRKFLELAREDDRERFKIIVESVVSLWDYMQKNNEKNFTVTEEAMNFYNKVTEEMERKILERDDSSMSMGWARNQVHILKIAMLLEIGKQNPSFTIDIDTMKEACRIVVEYFLPNFMDIINRLQENVKNNHIEKIRSVLLKNNGRLDRSQLLKNSRLIAKDFNAATETMIESSEINRFKEEGSNKEWFVLNDDKKSDSQISSFSQISPIHT